MKQRVVFLKPLIISKQKSLCLRLDWSYTLSRSCWSLNQYQFSHSSFASELIRVLGGKNNSMSRKRTKTQWKKHSTSASCSRVAMWLASGQREVRRNSWMRLPEKAFKKGEIHWTYTLGLSSSLFILSETCKQQFYTGVFFFFFLSIYCLLYTSETVFLLFGCIFLSCLFLWAWFCNIILIGSTKSFQSYLWNGLSQFDYYH